MNSNQQCPTDPLREYAVWHRPLVRICPGALPAHAPDCTPALRQRASRVAPRTLIVLLSMLAALVAWTPAQAEQVPPGKVLVLDFGLLDGTMLPRVPAELARTATLGPLLREKLAGFGIEVIPRESPPAEIALIESGYLTAHPTELAALGRKHGAAWVAIGQQTKFSFLISWLNVQVVDVDTGTIVARAESALRGSMDDLRMSSRTMDSLALQLNDMLRKLADRKQAVAP